MKTFPTLPVLSRFFLVKCCELFVTLALLVFACGNAGAQEEQPVIPEPPYAVSEVDAATLDTIGVTALRGFNPGLTGSGVRVAQPEATLSTNEFEVRPSYAGQPQIFTYTNNSGQTSNVFPNTVGTESQHADIVGQAFYGKTNSSNPEGVAYGVGPIDSYDAGYFLFNRIGGNNSIFAKVANQSFIYPGPHHPGVDQSYDNYVALHNTIFVSGVGNADPQHNNGRPSSPAAAYNVIGVGAFGGATSIGPTVDNGRSKPDITAPATLTSYSTPLVSGAAAILVQAAGSTANAKDPRTVKALLLNGAIKPLYQPNAADRWTHTETAPLDRRYGSGILNVFNSYKQFQAGRRAPGSYAGVQSGWDFNSVAASSAKTYSFTLSGGPYTGTATLVWHRRQNQSSINNLNLSLSSGGTVFGSSASTVDNVEHLFLEALPAGSYDLKVERSNNLVSGNENYALAFNFAPMQLTGAASRKVHGGAGAFDVPLPLTGAAGIECRGDNGTHQVVFSFAVPVTFTKAEVTTGTGACASTSGSGTNSITVNLTGVGNAQTITVTLFGVNDSTNITDLSVKMGVLLGDSTADGSVNSADITQTRRSSGQPVTAGPPPNFRDDFNLDGGINSADITLVRRESGTALP